MLQQIIILFCLRLTHQYQLIEMIDPPCPIAQYYRFSRKDNLDAFPIISNPYLHPSPEYLKNVTENLQNKDRVCALQYANADKSTYHLKEFSNRSEAETNNFIVTHQGKCGKCSSTRDLYVYLTVNLTNPVRKCGLHHFASTKKLRTCLLKLGFTPPCAEVWLWNTKNTKKNCGLVCLQSLLLRQPFVINGELNPCLACDQTISGPIFKYQSGRTRRNSGISSEIDRPKDQIYNLTHCYY